MSRHTNHSLPPRVPGCRRLFHHACRMLLATAAVLVLGGATPHQDSEEGMVQIRAVPARAQVVPGESVAVAVEFRMQPGWHTWTSADQVRTLSPGMVAYEDAQYTSVTGSATPADSAVLHLDHIQWPVPHPFSADLGYGKQTYPVFEGTVVAYLPVVVSPDAKPGTITLDLTVHYQACSNQTCLFPTEVPVQVQLTVTPGEVGPGVEPELFAGFDPTIFGSLGSRATNYLRFPFFEWELKLDQNSAIFFPLLLVLAFVGGILLNFTPCVLPVIPLKIMGLSAAAAGERRRTFMLGLAMSAGVAGFWLALGVLLGTVRQFNQISEFFQYPAFTISVGIFITFMAIGMAGFYNIGLPQWVYAIEPKHETYGGSVIFGVMTAVLSTPCTAPLMGAAAAWAVATKEPGTVMAVFLAIGTGMASPYIVLSAFPQLARRVPKTGPASNVLKQVMGLLLLAAGAYFIGAGVNAYLSEPSKVYWWVISVLAAGAGVWLLVRTIQIARTWHNRVIFCTVAVLITAISAAIGPLMTYEPLPWKRYTPEAFAQALKRGNVVVLDFTAEWCLNCKVLEKTMLEAPDVASLLNEPGVTLLKADITGNNPPALEKMKELHRSSIPLLVIYAPSGTEVFQSDAYTQGQVIAAVRAAQGKPDSRGALPAVE